MAATATQGAAAHGSTTRWRRRRRRERLTPAEQVGLGLFALVAAAGAVFADGRPTAAGWADVAWRAAYAVLVVLAASRCRRWAWLVLAGPATVLATWPWQLAGVAALGLALYGAGVAPRRQPVVGAAIGALAVQALLHGADIGPFGSSAVVAALVTLPVLVTAYRLSSRRVRRRAAWGAAAVGGLALVLSVVAGLAALSARTAMVEGIEHARRGLELARDGKQAEAAVAWGDADEAFSRASDAAGSPWARPALVVPVTSQHLDAVHLAATSGQRVSRTAAAAARGAPYQELRSDDGRVDVQAVRSMEPLVADAATAVRTSVADLRDADRGWLVDALATPMRELLGELSIAGDDAQLAADTLAVAPAILGGDGPRRYVVLFTTPAESRFGGGFIGGYGELTAVDGKVSLVRTGHVDELNEGATARTLDGEDEFLARHGRLSPTRFFQNAAASPDFATTARVVRQLYPQGGRDPVDGVILVDPFGLAGLMELTGPISLPESGLRLNPADAADFLLTEQYVRFPDSDARSDRLTEVAEATFEELTTGDLPELATATDALGDLVAQGRLQFTTWQQDEVDLLRRLHLAGTFPGGGDGDLFSLRTSNANPNKIDPYLRRAVRYEAAVDPATGGVDVEATVKLSSFAPSATLPDAVVGNRDVEAGRAGRPRGSNTMYLSVYSPLDLDGATLDGQPLSMETQRELGYRTYSTQVTVPPGGSVQIQLRLRGTLPSGGSTYRLVVPAQPTVLADDVTYVVTSSNPDWRPLITDAQQETERTLPLEEDTVIEVPMQDLRSSSP